MTHKESIEDYILGEQLGHGQFARVHLAQNRSTKELFAIKIIDLSKMTDKLVNESMVQQRVLNEVNIHCDRGLRHPSIVRCFNVFADGRNVYLVLEYCNMGTLKSYVENKKRLTEREARTILSQIVNALLVLHANKVMHRDISMGNVLLNRDSRNNVQAKIADFGLAERLESPDMKHFTMCGTPNYMSPEVANGTGHGLETDIFSLGSVLYTMLVGGPPFESSNVQETINNIKGVLYKMPNLLSSKAQHLIMSVMRLNPLDRLTLNEIRDHPFLTGGSLEDFKNRYPRSSPCTEWSMDSGRGTTVSTLLNNTDSKSNSLSSTDFHVPGVNNQLQTTAANPIESAAVLRPMSRNTISPGPQLYSLATSQRQLTTPRPDQRLTDSNAVQKSENYRTTDVNRNAERQTAQYVVHLPPQPPMSSSSSRHTPSPSPAVSADVNRKALAGRRMTPVLPRRADTSQQLSEFVSNADGGNVSSSSLSETGSVQTPVLSHSSKNSSLSEDAQNMPAEQFVSSDLSLDNDTCSVHSTPGVLSRLPLCSSETNLAGTAAAATMPRPHSHHRHVDHSIKSQQTANKPAVNSAEYMQQLRRRSRSAENLSQRSRQSSRGDTWSTVDIDINSQQNEGLSAPNGRRQQPEPRSKSALGQRIVDGLPPAFSAVRLRPFRQQMNNIVYTILEDGIVVMEFFREVNGVATVMEALYISVDGLKIKVYKPNSGKGCPLGLQPPQLPSSESVHVKHFMHESLPKSLWRRYSYAARFVSLIKARTPKVTLFTKRAKFQLMENSDAEVMFYNGAKYHKTNDSVRLILRDGTIKHLHGSESLQELSEEGQELCQYVNEILQVITNLCNTLSTLQAHCGRGPDMSMFPIVIGRRSSVLSETTSTQLASSSSLGSSDNRLPDVTSCVAPILVDANVDISQATDSSSLMSSSTAADTSSRVPPVGTNAETWSRSTGHLRSANMRPASARSVQSQRSASSELPVRALAKMAMVPEPRGSDQRSVSSSRSGDRQYQQHPRSGGDSGSVQGMDKPSHIIDVHGVGRAFKFSNGIVWIHYNDGSRLAAKMTTPKYVINVDTDGHSVTYGANDELPELVRNRIANDLQIAMEQLNLLQKP